MKALEKEPARRYETADGPGAGHPAAPGGRPGGGGPAVGRRTGCGSSPASTAACSGDGGGVRGDAGGGHGGQHLAGDPRPPGRGGGPPRARRGDRRAPGRGGSPPPRRGRRGGGSGRGRQGSRDQPLPHRGPAVAGRAGRQRGRGPRHAAWRSWTGRRRRSAAASPAGPRSRTRCGGRSRRPITGWRRGRRRSGSGGRCSRRRGGGTAPTAPEALAALGQLAHVLRHRGRLDPEVLEMARTASDGLVRALGPDHPDTLDSRNNLAVAYLQAGRAAEAIAALEENVRIEEADARARPPPDAHRPQQPRRRLRDAGRTAEAIAMLEATLARAGGRSWGPTTSRRSSAAATSPAPTRMPAGSPRPARCSRPCRQATEGQAGPRPPRDGRPPSATSPRSISPRAAVADGRAAVRGGPAARHGPGSAPTIPRRSRDMQNLAVAYRGAGRLSEALPMLEQALAAMKSRSWSRPSRYAPRHDEPRRDVPGGRPSR